MRHSAVTRTVAAGLMLWLCTTTPAFAYVGPGMGIGVIGAIVGLVMTLVLAFVGLLWYPVKRLLRRKAPDDGALRNEPAGTVPGKGEPE